MRPWSADPATRVDGRLIGDDPYDGLTGRTSQINGLCLAAHGKQLDVAMARIALSILEEEDEEEEKKAEEKDKKAAEEGDKKDANSDEKKTDEKDGKDKPKTDDSSDEAKKKKRTNPRLKRSRLFRKKTNSTECPSHSSDLCWLNLLLMKWATPLGLRHNFKASGAYTLEQINSGDVKGKKPLAGSVMDYLPSTCRKISAKDAAIGR